MNYRIIATHRFEKEIKRLAKKFPSLKSEFTLLLNEIEEKPGTGVFIGNGCYKIRIAIGSKGKGKRGGARVVTHLYLTTETVYLLTIYDKSEKSDVKPKELKEMIENLELDG
jgi:mRNA-degrading endonuclease RelE of RelBE toxin-antitoxin system